MYNGKPLSSKLEAKVSSPFDYFFEQKLDHFDRANHVTFQQRYFKNETYWRGASSGAPVFLCVGGEGPPLDYLVLVSSVHCNDMVELAEKQNALLLALEHRYYGLSIPNDDLSTDNLRWLNTEQALGDIASFHDLITKEYGLTSANKWVSWGGSYPGMLAGLARLRYPHLFHASVSSSSPLEAAVEMFQYNDVVAESMAAVDVGGSPECLAAISSGHATIGEMLKTPAGRRSLESTFNICGVNALENPLNQEQFAGDGVVYLPVQSNDPSCTTPFCDIASVCVHMTNTSIGDPLTRLATLAAAQNTGPCTVASYETMIKAMKNPKNLMRSWLYQTCTEWGFYQTCPIGSKCPYTQGLHTLDIDYDICLEAFDITADEVDYQITYTNEVYGGSNIQGSRIMFPNGQIDPWHALGVLEEPNPREPVLWVRAASHHFWTHPSLPTDSVYVKAARVQIWNQVDAWLREE